MPLLETPDGSIVFESAVIMNFAQDFAKPGVGLPIWPHEAAEAGDLTASMKTAQMRLDMLAFDKFNMKVFGALMSRFKDETKIQEFGAAFPELENFVASRLNGKDFLSGTENPMMLDFHVYPILERIVMLENSPWGATFNTLDFKNKCPTVYAYVYKFRSHPKMTDHCF